MHLKGKKKKKKRKCFLVCSMGTHRRVHAKCCFTFFFFFPKETFVLHKQLDKITALRACSLRDCNQFMCVSSSPFCAKGREMFRCRPTGSLLHVQRMMNNFTFATMVTQRRCRVKDQLDVSVNDTLKTSWPCT